MHGCHAPITANSKLASSDLWNEPIRPETQKHRRFIWATQFGTGRAGSGAQGRKATQRAILSRAMKERVGAAEATTKLCERNRLARITPPRVIQGLLGAVDA